MNITRLDRIDIRLKQFVALSSVTRGHEDIEIITSDTSITIVDHNRGETLICALHRPSATFQKEIEDAALETVIACSEAFETVDLSFDWETQIGAGVTVVDGNTANVVIGPNGRSYIENGVLHRIDNKEDSRQLSVRERVRRLISKETGGGE